MALEDIVNVNVTIATATVSQRGFGTPLLYGYHAHDQDRVLTYNASSWSAAMVADGFTVGEPLYLAAEKLMAQSPRPKSFKVGRKTTAQTQILRITPTTSGASGTYVHSLTIEETLANGDTATYTVSVTEDGTPTVTELCTALASAINATAVGHTAAAVGGTHVTLTGDAANRMVNVINISPYFTLTEDSTTTGDSADLTAIYTEDSDWYCLVPVTTAPTTLEVCADWAETQPVLMIANTTDQGCLDDGVTSDIMSSIQTQAYARSAIMYHSRPLDFAAAAWAGIMLPYQPGRASWKFKTLAGVNADRLTAEQEAAVLDKNGNFYSNVSGKNITQDGKTGSGQYIRFTQISDWTSARVKEAVFSELVADPLLPMDDDGGNRIYGAIDSVYREGVVNKAFKSIPTAVIEVPKAADLSDADRAAGTWSGITASFKLLQSVNKVDTINLFLTV